MAFLKVQGISKTLGATAVLNDIGFEQHAGQKVAIAGETGSGKTTLLKVIAGLVQPDTGRVWFEDRIVDGPDFQLVPGHPAIGFLSQHYELRNNYYVEELLSYANKLPSVQAQTLYDVCRISHLVKRRTDQLSGGEKQRIALARLLVGSPKLLLLDEPYSNLDHTHKKILKAVIADISAKLSVTCLLTSHDPADLLSWAENIIVMREGKLVQQDSPENIYRRPQNAYVAGLFGNYYYFSEEEAAPFGIHFPPHAKGQKLFVRPGDFITPDKEPGMVSGSLIRSSFLGNYYELEVSLAGKIVRLMSPRLPVNNGKTIPVSLQIDQPWFLQDGY